MVFTYIQFIGLSSAFFFFNDTATTDSYTLSLHDALPIFLFVVGATTRLAIQARLDSLHVIRSLDRKSTRLNSSHVKISYAVFCLKKKNKETYTYALLLQEVSIAHRDSRIAVPSLL